MITTIIRWRDMIPDHSLCPRKRVSGTTNDSYGPSRYFPTLSLPLRWGGDSRSDTDETRLPPPLRGRIEEGVAEGFILAEIVYQGGFCLSRHDRHMAVFRMGDSEQHPVCRFELLDPIIGEREVNELHR